ncbi:MAG: di-trans,poly-cis-decaprenylcistransferase [Chromatiaceae bacterium]|nr:di-trans,poly-cis-decaprenylcistransferase [Gammaproteobacteria bacterium]MCP5318575.1 di-trans,poly-cis-decaprenylcistransferase [Chromatiaceae bacterium]MCW5586680.1 di-trans,poly-cis-decaprenylcistransferase [Chromatiales bacterium]MCP5430479.1 di-trans,poly-cis-decaprenylcistransferase [Chromatiaceae bacterium]MCP5435213.1 di-trans,poly-cis-decaprenylcistransferase [Chromatiaceae bacterium]
MADEADTGGIATQAGAIPSHVAIIMDGNGRWAEARGQARHAGHRAGVNSVRSTIEECIRHGVKVLTLFAFSSENWRRPKGEVSLLMELFLTALQREVKRMQSNDIQLRVIGDISAFPDKLQQRIRASEDATRDNQRLVLQIAANYGGRWDITQAARRLAGAVRNGELDPDDIDEEAFARATALGDLPDPDLFIRTGGELRISNFLLWHCAYTELYFTPVLWPDFDAEAFAAALAAFASRQRRFGQTGAQLGG